MNLNHSVMRTSRNFQPCERLFSGFLTVLAVATVMLFSTASAWAACGDLGSSQTRAAIKLPAMPKEMLNESLSESTSNQSIVGLWHVIYTTDQGAKFNESFDEWHADGTEFEQAILPPAVGDICFGVWKQTAARTVQLHHVGWIFDPNGKLTGSFVIYEINTVSLNGGTYQGRFDFKVYDLDGNFVPGTETKGTMLATRFTV